MSYRTVIDGLHECFDGVGDLKAKHILDYEPTSVVAFPTLYTLLDRVERKQEGQLTVMNYRILNRVVFQWVNNEKAEEELIPYVNLIPAAIDRDAQLGGRLDKGLARVEDIEAVVVKIGGTMFRALDIYARVLEKGAFRGGL